MFQRVYKDNKPYETLNNMQTTRIDYIFNFKKLKIMLNLQRY